MVPGPTSQEGTEYFPDLSRKLDPVDAFPYAIGEHSDLYRAMRKGDEAGQVLAVKTLRSGSANDSNFLGALQELLLRLGGGWGQLSHENIARVYGVTYVFGIMPGIVTDFYEYTIVSYMAEHRVSDEEKLTWSKQIASGLHYLHRRSPPILHGNLRGANVFLDYMGKCVVADVGIAYITDMPEFTVTKSATSCRWTAPELMDPKLPPPSIPSPFLTMQTDVFAFAMTIAEIFTEAVPFPHKKNDSSAIALILAGERPELPPYVKNHRSLAFLVPACWRKQPEKRPTMSYVCWKLGLISTFSYYLGW